MKYYGVYILKNHKYNQFILRTDKPLETLELWARTVVNKYYPDFKITDVDFVANTFFFFDENSKLIIMRINERGCYNV